jgi:ElaB/YqjD/DUF883 family membrane-anchored ribosome-binding protein
MNTSNVVQATEERVTDAAVRASEKAGELAGAFKAQVAQFKEKAGEFGDRLRVAATEAKDGLVETGKATQEKLSEGIDRAGESYDDVKDSLGEVVSDLLDQAASASEKVANYVRANPGRSFAAAVALGYIASRLVKSRRAKKR